MSGRIVTLYQLYRLMEIAGISRSLRRPTANIGALDGGFPSHTSILRSDVAKCFFHPVGIRK